MRSPLLLIVPALLATASTQAAAPDTAWFQRHTQALYDGVTSGDPKPWDEDIAPDCLYTSEDGLTQDKTALLKTIAPLPKGFSGGIKVEEFETRDAGSAVVTHYINDEWEDVFGQHLHTKYVNTDTWGERDGKWQIVATHATVVPRDEDPVPVDPKVYAAVVGSYSFDPSGKRVYEVFVRDGKLFGGATEDKATQLIPLSPLVYFQAGSIHTMIFVADAGGQVTELREIHKYNELAYKRLPTAP
ncbi:MAG TPA: nuclear transport factor 2 family protein [Gammaproteobacteria bacterium]|jgi:hypothetical protein